MRNNKLVFSSTRNLQFYRFQTLKVFFLNFGFCRIDMNDILWKSDIKSRRQDQTVDQTELDSVSESEKIELITSNVPFCLFHMQFKRSC